ncbi:hypothetical protein C8F04DRAFT_1203682 [Mycena alexandri]|uniref:Uncharacterized protein n=1 Tax=Mycena alexandri TaxID=1745969 RepID=A0AAD6WKY3_9AGAR|nr:hypothetical protein C8F04DRAFT_1203682 [Mycena alexandri]
MPTYLYKDKDKDKKSIWCLTRAPFSTTTKNPEHSPPDAVLFTRASDEERRRSMVEYIQQYEKQGVGRAFSLLWPCCQDKCESSLEVKAEQNFRSRVRMDLGEELGREPIRSEISTRTREKKKGKKCALAIKWPPSFKIQSKCLQERYRGKAGALLLRSQASRLLGVKRAEIGDIDVDSDMGAEENSVEDIDENESVVDMESMVDSEEDGSSSSRGTAAKYGSGMSSGSGPGEPVRAGSELQEGQKMLHISHHFDEAHQKNANSVRVHVPQPHDEVYPTPIESRSGGREAPLEFGLPELAAGGQDHQRKC